MARRPQLGINISSILARPQDAAVWCYRWLGGASRWKIILVGSLLGILLAALLSGGEPGLKESPQGTPGTWGCPD